MFYVIMETMEKRDNALQTLKSKGIQAFFHYVPLHNSPIGTLHCPKTLLPVTENISFRLMRLPFFNDLTEDEQTTVIQSLIRTL
jgi:dTDP-4-amino-4,6-dideoxygalactose transaminase